MKSGSKTEYFFFLYKQPIFNLYHTPTTLYLTFLCAVFRELMNGSALVMKEKEKRARAEQDAKLYADSAPVFVSKST